MTDDLLGAGTTSVPAPAVGPDRQTLTVACATCQGAGYVMERHEAWASEQLGCPDCCHPDNAEAGEGRVWRFYLLKPNPHGPWLLRDAAGAGSELGATEHGLGHARWLLHQAEHKLTAAAVANASAFVVAAARRWRLDRLAGQLGADEPLESAVAQLEAALAAFDRVDQAHQ